MVCDRLRIRNLDQSNEKDTAQTSSYKTDLLYHGVNLFTFHQPRVIYWHLALSGVIPHITTRGKYIGLQSPQHAKPEAY